jgi:hypothetical protein
MPNIYNAGTLASIIAKLAEMDVPDLGSTSVTQNNYIYQFMNIALMKLARIAFIVTYSDPLPIAANGQYTFKKGNVAITDLYEPQVVLDATETEMQKRTSYSAPTGWWRDSQNQEVHFRGVTAGNYVLKYLKYPARVTQDSDTVEFPPSGYDALIKEVISLIKYAKNSYAGAEFMDGKAKASMSEATQGSMSSRGTGSSGQPPGPNDTTISRGG